MDSKHPDVILDSGAYSVWRSGANVDYGRYRDYCKVVADCTLTCVNLDVIPGAWGSKPTPDEVEIACKTSYFRWQQLSTESGALIMPVFHQTDAMSWLDRYLDAGALYIGISPTDTFSSTSRQEWLHQVHEYITNHGLTLNKDVFTHCLGVFAPKVLYNLPAWSADASTLLRYVAMKRILLPKLDSRGRILAWNAVPVSSRAGVSTEPVDWDVLADWLESHQIPFEKIGGRIIIDDPAEIIRANMQLAKMATRDTGVRCFIAGQHPLAIYTVTVDEKYPYILRSYAVIKEREGVTIRHVYNRTCPKPNRRPEKDHKVEAPRGLFTF